MWMRIMVWVCMCEDQGVGMCGRGSGCGYVWVRIRVWVCVDEDQGVGGCG